EEPVDVRIICATHRNLRECVDKGSFRQDLYYRLNVIELRMPPLRERREDIPALVTTLLETIAKADPTGATPTAIVPAALEALRAHDWPGNVRELRNVLERAAYLARAAGQTEITLAGLPFAAAPPPSASGPVFDPAKSYRETKAEHEELFEKQYVTWLLARHEGNISGAAREADMDRKHLFKLARKHSLR
ncbi:MAG: sigma-54-dependent Fis family transcriptional regulator, partial [Sandaracinaceae bacterium]|nr:sigma-54-dependent Fis family transcriptional regulator [Sandaracinaceae bacterium]